MNPDIHKLLRFKRYEHPTPDYFERFLDEFHERQRADLLKQSALKLMWERMVDLMPSMRIPRLAYAGVAAMALILSAVILSSQQGETMAPASLALNAPTPVINTAPLARQVMHLPDSSRSDFPPHYVLESRPVSYESPYSF